jgi:hypothetical protein
MTSAPRQSARFHYEAAERLLAAAESSVTAEMQCVDAALAVGHALLAAAPRRARKAPPRVQPPTGGSPRERWLSGTDTEGNDQS